MRITTLWPYSSVPTHVIHYTHMWWYITLWRFLIFACTNSLLIKCILNVHIFSIMAAISKTGLERLIKTGSSSVTIGNCSTIRPEIVVIEHNGIHLKEFVYCKLCQKVLTVCKGTTGNIFRHCKRHDQSGGGVSSHLRPDNYHPPSSSLAKPHSLDIKENVGNIKFTSCQNI